MHPNPTFRQTPREMNADFARERGFGVMSVNGPDGPLLSHIPFLLNTAGDMAEVHFVRSNPIVAALRDGAQPAVLAVSGPDGYVSPDWYGIDDQVPTWNYVAVHLRGTLEPLPPEELRGVIDRLATEFETRLAPKPVWHSAKMSDGVMERMMRAILPFRLRISRIDGTWKLNQNKADDVRLSAAEHMGAQGIGSETALLAALMHGAGPQG